MSFIEPPPSPPPGWRRPEPHREPWQGTSADTVGVPLSLVRVLARTDAIAVIVSGFVVYPAGISFNVVTVHRMTGPHPPQHPNGPRADWDADGSRILRLGVRFADGSKVTNLDSMYGYRPRDPGERMLQQRGGGGGGRKFTTAFWCQPLPPPGPLALVCEWPLYGIPQTEESIDAALILSAAERAKPLWEDDVGLAEPADDTRPPGSSGGWTWSKQLG